MVRSNCTVDGSEGLIVESNRRAASESSGCIRMKDIPVLDQSVFKKVGRLLS